MTKYLSLTDLFLIGLALDVCGAVLLAKGLLLGPRDIARLNTYWGINEGALSDRIQNRVYAEFGMLYLGVGFGLQAVGYSLEIGGIEAGTGPCGCNRRRHSKSRKKTLHRNVSSNDRLPGEGAPTVRADFQLK